MQIGEVIADHKKTGYKEIYTGVEYFKIYAMDTVDHGFKYDFIITDAMCCDNDKDLSPLKMLTLVKRALYNYVYTAYDDGDFFDDFLYGRPFQNKSLSISAKVLFLLPRTRNDLFDRGAEGIYHFYLNADIGNDNFVSDRWKKTPKINGLRFIVPSLEKDKWTEEMLKLLKREQD